MSMSIGMIRWKFILMIPLLVVFMVFTGCPTPDGSNGEPGEPGLIWHIDAVDTDAWTYTSIALDDSGYPYISYGAAGQGGVKFVRWTGSAWDGMDASAGPDTVDTEGGSDTSIALDDNGYPHISYYAGGVSGGLKYTHWTGSAWDGLDASVGPDMVDHTDNFVGYDNSIALDTSGYPHISYYDSWNSALKYARWTGSNWDGLDASTGPDFLDVSGAVGKYTSIALDDNGYPHISYSYFDATNYDLKYVRWTGSAWDGLTSSNPDTVDTSGNVGIYTSIALDDNGYPHISYFDGTNYDLKYARWTGSAWDGLDASAGPDAVDTTGDVGSYTSIALDSSGYPHISYIDKTKTALKYVRWTGSTWDGLDASIGPDTVDTAKPLENYTSIALDDNGYPHISYLGGYTSLKYARYGY